MEVKHIHKNNYRTTSWSGGTTTELFIYPESASFPTGDYDVRISIASVEVEQSIFTSLPEVERTLMVLKGQLRLEHEGHHSIDLEEFEQDKFEGDWNTTSFGKAIDFNVMTRNGVIAVLQKVDLVEGELLTLASSYAIQFVYVLEGKIQINEFEINEGDSMSIQTINHPKIIAAQTTTIILVSVDIK